LGKRGPNPKPKPLGAPLRLSEGIIETLVRALRAGAYVETAVAHASISKGSYYSWIKKGGTERDHIEKGGKPRKSYALYLALLDAVEKAQADAELKDLATIGAASAGDWRAAAWKLERRNPSKWGRQRLDINTSSQLIVEGAGWLSDKVGNGNG
jgi:transposase